MKNFRLLCIVVICSGATMSSSAQTSDWQALQQIASGTPISITLVKHRGRREYELLTVTSSDLTCELERGMFHRHRTFLRDDIGEVRLEYPERHHGIAGALIGGAAGAAIGALLGARSGSGDLETQRAAQILGPLTGISFGAGIGTGIGRATHQHGAVVYQRK